MTQYICLYLYIVCDCYNMILYLAHPCLCVCVCLDMFFFCNDHPLGCEQRWMRCLWSKPWRKMMLLLSLLRILLAFLVFRNT
ncbi:hypothetical protein VIGAN_05099800, partial [Vigna angularis var. angularis]